MKAGTPPHVRRYRRDRLALLVLAYALGLGIAYAEHRLWLPRHLLVESVWTCTTKARIGPSLGHSLVIPMLMLSGLSYGDHYHVSRACLFLSSLALGADTVYPLLTPSPALLASAVLSLLWLHLLMRTDVESARGIHCRRRTVEGAPRLSSYLGRLCLLWGEAICIRFLFYSTAS